MIFPLLLLDASNFKCFALYILDENNNEIKEFELSGVNKAASNNETTVWSALPSNKSSGQYISKEVTSTNNLKRNQPKGRYENAPPLETPAASSTASRKCSDFRKATDRKLAGF